MATGASMITWTYDSSIEGWTMDEQKPIEVARQLADIAIATGYPRRTLNIALEIVEIRDAAEKMREYDKWHTEAKEAGCVE